MLLFVFMSVWKFDANYLFIFLEYFIMLILKIIFLKYIYYFNVFPNKKYFESQQVLQSQTGKNLVGGIVV
jgi:hypothetical protein